MFCFITESINIEARENTTQISKCQDFIFVLIGESAKDQRNLPSRIIQQLHIRTPELSTHTYVHQCTIATKWLCFLSRVSYVTCLATGQDLVQQNGNTPDYSISLFIREKGVGKLMTNTLLLTEGEGKDTPTRTGGCYVLPTPPVDHTQYTAICI